MSELKDANSEFSSEAGKHLQYWGDFYLGFALAVLLSMFIMLIFIFAAVNEPENFGESYREIFCTNLK